MSDTNNNTEKRDIGACWVRVTKAQDKMLSMKINLKSFGIDKEVELVGWLNRNKVAGDKRPDFHLFPSEPRAGGSAPARTAPAASPKTAPAPTPAPEDNQIL